MAKRLQTPTVLNGRQQQNLIERFLFESGYTKIKDKAKLVKAANSIDGPSYARQVHIGTTIYGTKLKCSFFLIHPQKWRQGLVIQAKWQKVGGTVDEKYPYLVHNVYASEYETILVIDGGGYRPGAMDWLRYMQRGNLLHVFHMADFQRWVNQGNL